MCLFVETLRVEEGEIVRLGYHNERMNRTRRALFGVVDPLDLSDYVQCPAGPGRFKGRVVYGEAICEVSCSPYQLRPVKRLKLVRSDEVDYRYKSIDRAFLNALFARRGEADDVLVVRHGLLTDTSICNIALWDGRRWLTPDHPLLEGTHRAALLDTGLIFAAPLFVEELGRYSRIRLFNALIGFGEIELDLSAILV